MFARAIPKRWRRLAEAAFKRGLIKPSEAVEEPSEATVFLGFEEWVHKYHPRFIWYRHNREVAKVLQKVADGEIRRLMIFWPPRHGKTEMVSRLFAAYCLYRFPEKWVALTSYGADLAHELSAQAMENFVKGGGNVHPRSGARKYWRTLFGGGMWATGVGGPATGRGFHYGIIDDPLKNSQEADSEVIRQRLKEWYSSTFYTRGEPGEAIVIILTRWHTDDLAGWQLEQEKEAVEAGEDGEPENWYIVNLQAIRDFDDEMEFPSSCEVMPDWRSQGEPLCPERYPLQRLKRLMARIGQYFWGALFQQNPVPRGGSVFKRSWFNQMHISQIPPMRAKVGGVDLAISKKESADYTVLFPLGVDAVGRYYLFRPYREQVESPEAVLGVSARATEAGLTKIGVESVAYQAAFVQYLRKRPEMRARAIVPVKADRDKGTRARGWSPIAEAGLITLVTDGTGWEQEFLKEAQEFPRGKHDDQVDGVGIAFATLAGLVTGSAVAGSSEAVTDGLKSMKSVGKQAKKAA